MVKRAKPLILCDTNVFLAYYREEEELISEIRKIGLDRLLISTVSIGEVARYMKKKEANRTKQLLNEFTTAHITKPISLIFEQLMFEYSAYHPDVADGLIAATAISNNAQLFTFNRKHFTYYQGLTLYNPAYSH